MRLSIYDEQNLEDILVTGTHNYAEDESYLRVEGHNLVSIGVDDYDDTIDTPELKKEIVGTSGSFYVGWKTNYRDLTISLCGRY